MSSTGGLDKPEAEQTPEATKSVTGVLDIYVDFKTLKVGDRFVESEYGSTLFLTVITKPKLERPDYMTFKARSDGGRTVDYGFQYPSGAYNPTIWHPAIFGEGTRGSPQQDTRGPLAITEADKIATPNQKEK